MQHPQIGEQFMTQHRERSTAQAHLWKAHDLPRGREHKDTPAQQVVRDAVHKLPRRQAVHKLTLPIPDAVQPVDAPRHDLLVQLYAAIAPRLRLYQYL